jgi:hypothetical protein
VIAKDQGEIVSGHATKANSEKQSNPTKHTQQDRWSQTPPNASRFTFWQFRSWLGERRFKWIGQ